MRGSGTGNEVRWKPDETVLPMRAVETGSKTGGVVLTLFGAAWCAFLLVNIWAGTQQTGVNVPMTLLLLAFALPGLLMALVGLRLLLARREIVVDRERVQVRDRGPGAGSWSEPLSAYRGVLGRFVHHQGGAGQGASRTWYLVVLAHPDASRDVVLFRSRRGASWLEARDRFAQLLGLPALEDTAGGVRATDPELQGVSLREKIRRGAVPVANAPEGLPDLGAGVRVERTGDHWTLEFRRARTAWRGALGVAVTLACYGAAHWIGGSEPESGIAIFCWLMLGFAALSALSCLLALRGRERLVLESGRVRLQVRPGRRESEIPLASLESVLVKGDPRAPGLGPSLVLAGGGRELRFARGLALATQERVAKWILAVIARGVERAPWADDAPRAHAPVEIGATPARQRRLAAMLVGGALGFVALLAVLMHLAFGSNELAFGSNELAFGSNGSHAPESPRRALDTPRNRVLKAWHGHYSRAERAVADQDLGLAEREFRLALAESGRLRDRGPRLSTLRYLAWVLERTGRTDQAAAFQRRAERLEPHADR